MSAVEARDVFRVHSTPEGDAAALQGLTLSVEAGEVVAVVGPSGAGKTSLLRVLAGADRPSAGSVRVFEWDVPTLNRRALARYRANVLGYVDQHYSAALDRAAPARARRSRARSKTEPARAAARRSRCVSREARRVGRARGA